MTAAAAWMAYTLVIGGLLTGAALLAERSARAAGRPTRWIWAAALALGVALPLAAWLWPAAAPAVEGAAVVLRLQPVSVDAAAVPGLPVDTLLVGAWLLMSGAFAVVLFAAMLRLRRARGRWQESEVDGVAVLLSDDVGPAVVGLGRARIVMPRWTLGIDGALRRLLLLHESEHVRSGDPRLVFAGLLALVVAPWNVFAWLQYLRLRLAIEIDCDARVLRASRDARSYGELLLEVGRRRAEPALAVAFGEPRRFLEERIRMLPRALGRRHLARAGLLASAAVAVLLLAVCARDPMSSADPTTRAGIVESDQPLDATDVAAGPRFTPFTQRPELVNRTEVQALLAAHYPPLLRDAGIGGQALVWFFIDETGKVGKVQINRSSGHEALDRAALEIGSAMKFQPARNRDAPVPVWIAIPIVFATQDPEGSAGVKMAAPAGAGAPAAAADSTLLPKTSTRERRPLGLADADEKPVPTPFSVRPELRNQAEVQQALAASYPPLLRDAGIGGETLMWVHIDETGVVKRSQVHTSSGYPALDSAAVQVTRSMAFAPAQDEGKPVPVWIAIPIVFAAR